MTDDIEAFITIMQVEGLSPPAQLIPEKLYRFPSNGKQTDTAGWCKLFADGMGGVFGDFRTGMSEKWQANHIKRCNDTESRTFRQQCKQAKLEREAEEARQHQEAMTCFADLWRKARPNVDLNHPYLVAKGKLYPHGVRQLGQALLVPVYGEDRLLHGLQFIQPDGSKKFKTYTRKAGCFHVLTPEASSLKNNAVVLLAEGWATACSLLTATGYPTFIGFDCGNLPAVAAVIRRQCPHSRLLVCADKDTNGKGQHQAKLAAQLHGGISLIPRFSHE